MANGKPTLTATPIPEPDFGEQTPGDLLAQGKTLQKAGTPFVTAVRVQKPRDLDFVVKQVLKEAELAKDEFWYSMSFGGQRIEGPTIGLANTLAREWGNCAVTVDVQETAEAFFITPRFIDLERGSQFERTYRQRKGAVSGKFENERKLDMALQIGQSKAIRNVIVNSVPRWLVEQAMQVAKDSAANAIDPKKLEEIKAQLVGFFKEKGVTQEQLVAKVQRPIMAWTTRDVADFRADWKAIQSGEMAVSDLFPPKEITAPAGPIKTEDVTAATSTTPNADPSAPSPEEQRRIKEREIAESGGDKGKPAKKGPFG